MLIATNRRKESMWYRAISFLVVFTFSFSLVTPPAVYAQSAGIVLPAPGTMVNLSPTYIPPILRGVTVFPDNPLQFDFIVDSGDSGFAGEELRDESQRLVKYFLAALTIPEDDLWVNLSPYEGDRIVPEKLGITDLGRDLLAQDYLLKQLTASLIYPEDKIGQEFWNKVYAKAQELYGTTEIPVNTFNKVWVVPDRAEVFEKNGSALVVDTHLKVMLDEDYLAMNSNLDDKARGTRALQGEDVAKLNQVSSPVVRDVVIPAIEKEVNEGKNFAQLRQIYNAVILAAWFKQSLKESIVGQVYVDQGKVNGVDLANKNVKEEIYQKYLEAYKKGVYNFVKEDYDANSKEMIPRKYFSGGATAVGVSRNTLRVAKTDASSLTSSGLTNLGQMMARPDTDFSNVRVALAESRTDESAALRQSRADASQLTGVANIKNNFVSTWANTIGQQLGAASVEIVDTSDDDRLVKESLDAAADADARGEDGTRAGLIALPNGTYYTRSHPADTARSESRTFVATKNKSDKGAFNNWIDTNVVMPKVMGKIAGAAKGEKLYVIPYIMGPANSPFRKLGVQITTSRITALNMIRMARVGEITIGKDAWEAIQNEGDFKKVFKAIHVPGDLDNINRTNDEDDDRFFVHLPDENMMISYGSDYGGNALSGKKFYALRQGMYSARNEGWLAEHMLILEIENKTTGEKKYVTGAFPSASGKTNLAMLEVPDALKDKYAVRVVGDDIAWLNKGDDGRLYAINPENGYFGVVPGTNEKTNPNFFKAMESPDTILINVAVNRKTGEVWWEDKTDEEPDLTAENGEFWEDWTGQRIVDREGNDVGKPWAHPNSRATALSRNAPNISPDFENAQGVPISAMLFGGRVDTLEPLIRELPTAARGVYDGATMGVQATAAAEGMAGVLRRDPMAQRPFFSYPETQYFQHWLNVMEGLGDQAPSIFHINWFKKDDNGKFMWPGFGENLRALLWALDRAEGKGNFRETPIGNIPTLDAINRDGLNVDDSTMDALLSYDAESWQQEVANQLSFLRSLETEQNKAPQELVDINRKMAKDLAAITGKPEPASTEPDPSTLTGDADKVGIRPIVEVGKTVDLSEYEREDGTGIINPRSKQLIADLTVNFKGRIARAVDRRIERLAKIERGEFTPGVDDLDPNRIITDAYGNQATVKEILEGDWDVGEVPAPLAKAGAILTGPWAKAMAMSAISGRVITPEDRTAYNEVLDELQAEIPEGFRDVLKTVDLKKADGNLATEEEKIAYIKGKLAAVQQGLSEVEKVTPVRIFADLQDAVVTHGAGKLEGPQVISDIVNGRLTEFTKPGKTYKVPAREEWPVITIRVADLDMDRDRHVDFNGEDTPEFITSMAFALESIYDALKDDPNQSFAIVLPKLESPEEVKLAINMLQFAQDKLGIKENISVVLMNETIEAALMLKPMIWAGREHIKVSNVGRWDKGAADMRTFWFWQKKVYGDLGKVDMYKTLMDTYVRQNVATSVAVGVKPEGGMVTAMPSEGYKDPEVDKKAIRGIVLDKTYEWLMGYDYGWVASPSYAPLVQYIFQQPRELEVQLEERPYDEALFNDLLAFPEVPNTREGLYADVYETLTYHGGYRRTGAAIAIDGIDAEGKKTNARAMFDGATALKTNYKLWTSVHKEGLTLDDGTPVNMDLINELIDEVIANTGARYKQFWKGDTDNQIAIMRMLTTKAATNRHVIMYIKPLMDLVIDELDPKKAEAMADAWLADYNVKMDKVFSAKADASVLTPAATTSDLVNSVKDVLDVSGDLASFEGNVLEFRKKIVPYLADEIVLSDSDDVRQAAQRLLREGAISLRARARVLENSIHDFYLIRHYIDNESALNALPTGERVRYQGILNRLTDEDKARIQNLTVPAYNIRTGPPLQQLLSIFRQAKRQNVGAFILELALSEQRYADMSRQEFTAMTYAAALQTGYTGQIFMQGDHFQTKATFLAKDGTVDEDKMAAEVAKVEKAIDASLDAGEINIDIDPSTAVVDSVLEEILLKEREYTTRYILQRMDSGDTEFEKMITDLGGIDQDESLEAARGEADGIKDLRRKLVDDLEVGNYIPEYREKLDADGELEEILAFGLSKDERDELAELYKKVHSVTSRLTKHYIQHIREGEKKRGMQTVSIGVEERHVDNKMHKDFPSTVLGSMTLMNDVIQWSLENGYAQPSKLALQTGAMHGLGGRVDWGIFERHQLARKAIGVSVFVQHGTSTIPQEEFQNMPRVGSGEAHLATEYQKITFQELANSDAVIQPIAQVPDGEGKWRTIKSDRAYKMRELMETILVALISPEHSEESLDPVIVAKLKKAKLWDQREAYGEKWKAKWDAIFSSQKAQGKSHDEILIGILGDTITGTYTLDGQTANAAGAVKDLTKELGQFIKAELTLKLENGGLPVSVHRKIQRRFDAEFARIHEEQNVVGTKDLIGKIVTARSPDKVALPARSEALTSAIASADASALTPVKLDDIADNVNRKVRELANKFSEDTNVHINFHSGVTLGTVRGSIGDVLAGEIDLGARIKNVIVETSYTNEKNNPRVNYEISVGRVGAVINIVSFFGDPSTGLAELEAEGFDASTLTKARVEEGAIFRARKNMGISIDREVNRDSNLTNDLGMDSLELVEFRMDLEDDFNVIFDDREADGIATIAGFIDLIWKKVERDQAGASTTDASALTPVGGIDLNAVYKTLQIKRDDKGIPLPLKMQPIQNINIDGFIPVIINITPVNSLPLILGLADDESIKQISKLN